MISSGSRSSSSMTIVPITGCWSYLILFLEINLLEWPAFSRPSPPATPRTWNPIQSISSILTNLFRFRIPHSAFSFRLFPVHYLPSAFCLLPTAFPFQKISLSPRPPISRSIISDSALRIPNSALSDVSLSPYLWKSGFDLTDVVKCHGEFFLKVSC